MAQRIQKILQHLQPNPTAGTSHVDDLPPDVQVDFAELRDLLDGDQKEIKNAVRKLFESDSSFELNYEGNHEQLRELAFTWAKKIAAEKFVSINDITENPAKLIAFFEALGYFDHSTVTKLVVQYALFGGSIMHLGTDKHQELIPKIDSFDLTGIFAMSELGHGSDTAAIEATATYDSKKNEFVVATPTWTSQKYWPGNILHGEIATVFARLLINGEDKGVHSFLVPVRGKDGKLMPGVTVRDIGKKEGQNGVDNGALFFENVRIPQKNMLNRFSDVSNDGVYSSKLPTQRKHLGVTLSGFDIVRLIGSSVCLSGLKVAVTIATQYSHIRKQFGPTEDNEVAVITYTSHQRRLMPVIARIYAMDLFNKFLIERFEKGIETETPELHATAAGFKASVAWAAIQDAQICRECCGAQGYRASWRIAILRDDMDMWTTGVVDNIVLQQQVVKFLLPEYERQKNRGHFSGILSHMTKRNYKTLHGNVINNMWLKAAFEIREAELLRELSKKMAVLKNEGIEYFDSWNQNLPLILRLASAFVDRRIFSYFSNLLNDLSTTLQDPLQLLCNLDGLMRINADLGWFVSHGVMSAENAKYFDDHLTLLCGKVAEISLPLTEAFGVPQRCLPEDINIYEKPTK